MPLPIATSSIVKQAFRFLSLRTPSSLADNSPEVQAAADVYPEALRMILEIAEWSCASRIVTLSEATELPGGAPDTDMPHVYLRPHDLVALREVYGIDVAWRLDMTYLRCDQPETVKIRYTALIQNEDTLSATLRTAVALQMAVLMQGSYPVTVTEQQRIEDRLRDTVRMALRQDRHTASPVSAYDESHGWWDVEVLR